MTIVGVSLLVSFTNTVWAQAKSLSLSQHSKDNNNHKDVSCVNTLKSDVKRQLGFSQAVNVVHASFDQGRPIRRPCQQALLVGSRYT